MVHLHFNDDDDTFRGAEPIDDADTVALRHAQPLEDFLSSVP